MKTFQLLFKISLIIGIIFPSNAQFKVYSTFKDFENGKGIEYKTYKGNTLTAGNRTFWFSNTEDGKEKIKVPAKEIWGFTYKDHIFRVDGYMLLMLVSLGKVAYYENGFAHLDMMIHNSSGGTFSDGYFCYLSKSLNSEVIPYKQKDLKKFTEIHPEAKPLYDCNAHYSDYEAIRKCVAGLQGNEDK